MFDTTDPWPLFTRWLHEAGPTEPRVPESMQIATATPDGRPSVRTVLLKEHGPEGPVFYTNLGSRKSQQLLANPHIGFVLHFKGLERQIIGEGTVRPVTAEEADAYHATRPRGSQLGAWASRQTETLESRDVLVERIEALTARFDGEPVPRPEFWSGFRIEPTQIEFWQGQPDRLHDRCLFERTGDAWASRRLYP